MKSLFMSVVFAALTAFTFSHVAQAATEVTDQNYKQTLDAPILKGESVVVVFYANWCPHCKNFEPMVAAAEKKFKNVKFTRIDVDKNPMLSSRIRGLPTMMLVKGKKIVGILEGEAPSQEALEQTLQKVFGNK